MRVNGKDYRAVWWQDGAVGFVEQRALPHRFETGFARTVEEAARAIEDMAVRGAPTIGVMAGYALALAARLGEDICAARDRLARTRPTAVNLWTGLRAVDSAAPDPDAMLAAARAYDDAEVAAAEAIGEHGAGLVKPGARILTHCNAGWLAAQDWGTALSVVFKAARSGLAPFVWVDETRPRLQGARLTSWELTQEGIEHRIVADGAAAYLMRQGQVDLAVTGTDRVAANGDVANKIGTYGVALSANAHGVPFYVAAPLSSIDRSTLSGADITIEERSEDEVLYSEGLDAQGRLTRVRVAPEGAKALNPAFDVTPGGLVTGLITEVGIVDASRDGLDQAFGRGGRADSDGS